MNIQRIRPNARMSAAVVCNGLVFVAGQVADDASADVGGQTTQILAKIDQLLAEAGSSKERIVSANIWLADIATFGQMNGIWDAWVPAGEPPARACVGSRLAFPQYTVESAGIAAQGRGCDEDRHPRRWRGRRGDGLLPGPGGARGARDRAPARGGAGDQLCQRRAGGPRAFLHLGVAEGARDLAQIAVPPGPGPALETAPGSANVGLGLAVSAPLHHRALAPEHDAQTAPVPLFAATAASADGRRAPGVSAHRRRGALHLPGRASLGARDRGDARAVRRRPAVADPDARATGAARAGIGRRASADRRRDFLPPPRPFPPRPPGQWARGEPALADAQAQIAGAIFCPSDESGDARLFTCQLAQRCERMGVQFLMNRPIEGWEHSADRISAVRTAGGAVAGDHFVLAL